MGEEIIRFYGNGCWRVYDDTDFNHNIACPCGSNVYRRLEPTNWAVIRYFILHPKRLLQAVKEGVKRNA